MRFFANANYDFIGVRKYAYAVTAAVIIPGMILLAISGLNYSIEFTGGTLVQVTNVGQAAIDAGFRMAMNAIVDSNVSTILTAAFLFQFGTGPVKGFAVTLIFGILASMVTAIFVTRTFFNLYVERRPGLQTLSI